MPFCMALGFYEDDAGLAQFNDDKAHDVRLVRLSSKISYRIDPENEYPRNYSGHMIAKLKSGREIEINQPHMRGGMREPLTYQEIVEKFYSNAKHGGWAETLGDRFLKFCENLDSAPNMGDLKEFRN